MKIVSKDAEDTKKIGKKFVNKLSGGDALLLYGDLGAGKTTFVQGLAEGFGIKDRILSPTFVLQRIHEIRRKDIKTLNHIDLYRIENSTDIKNLGLIELFDDYSSITVIEWAERLEGFSPKKGFKVYFKYISGEQREIEIKKI